jgi:4'-phosphopantetheinyl transferase
MSKSGRFRFERDRRNFVAARCTLRRLLARYTGHPPENIRFRYSERGKPSLDSDTSLRFNISHSHGQALFALAYNIDIGVDIEQVRPMRPIAVEQLAQRFFAPAEYDAIVALPEAVRQDAFFDLWVRKEAYLKACGAGLGGGLASIPPNWFLYSLQAPRGFYAALAGQREVRVIQKQVTA